MSSMRRESKPLRYMLMVCRTKEAMPRSICPALALPCARALLPSCRTAELEGPRLQSCTLWHCLESSRERYAFGRLHQSQLGHNSLSSRLKHHFYSMQYSIKWTACSSCGQRLSWKL